MSCVGRGGHWLPPGAVTVSNLSESVFLSWEELLGGREDLKRRLDRITAVHGWEAREQHTLVSCRVPKKGANGQYRMTQGMMLIGGLNAKGDAALSDVWVTYKSSGAEGSNLGEHWEMVSANAPFGKRYGHTSVVTFADGVEKVYVIGGNKKGAERGEEDGRQNDVWCSEDGGRTWFVGVDRYERECDQRRELQGG